MDANFDFADNLSKQTSTNQLHLQQLNFQSQQMQQLQQQQQLRNLHLNNQNLHQYHQQQLAAAAADYQFCGQQQQQQTAQFVTNHQHQHQQLNTGSQHQQQHNYLQFQQQPPTNNSSASSTSSGYMSSINTAAIGQQQAPLASYPLQASPEFASLSTSGGYDAFGGEMQHQDLELKQTPTSVSTLGSVDDLSRLSLATTSATLLSSHVGAAAAANQRPVHHSIGAAAAAAIGAGTGAAFRPRIGSYSGGGGSGCALQAATTAPFARSTSISTPHALIELADSTSPQHSLHASHHQLAAAAAHHANLSNNSHNHYLHNHHLGQPVQQMQYSPPPAMSASDAMSLGINLEQYISKRNERERSRVRFVNDAFDNLKSILPLDSNKQSKRMSKVEILRSAMSYIRNLETLLDERQGSAAVAAATSSSASDSCASDDLNNNNNTNGHHGSGGGGGLALI